MGNGGLLQQVDMKKIEINGKNPCWRTSRGHPGTDDIVESFHTKNQVEHEPFLLQAETRFFGSVLT